MSLSRLKSPTVVLAIIAVYNAWLLLCVVSNIPKPMAFVHERSFRRLTGTFTSSKASTRIENIFSSPQPSIRYQSTALCGIKGFRLWFEQQFPNAIKRVDISVSQDSFDHVLVDMNQILHVILRRSRGQDHAIKLLMQELDQILQFANPKQSLVLAVDGPPAAAKIATQRKRRFALLRNTQFKLKHFDKLRMSNTQRAKRLRSYRSELRSLHLTPGTDAIQTMEQTLLYWAWQRLQIQGRPHSKLLPRVKVYISSSRVPGEGEIKLLEWVNNFRVHLSRNPGQSIALIGGDADLVLEAMIIPPSWTHNVFVLRPEELGTKGNERSTSRNGNIRGNDGKRQSRDFRGRHTMLCTSVWEMTRDLDDYCRTQLSTKVYNPEENKRDQNLLLQLRTDLVLLMILNGNDYLPKTVATDFRDVLDIYMTLMKQWLERNACGQIEDVGSTNFTVTQASSCRKLQAGLVDPNSLSFHLHFCAAFFRALGRNSPTDEERSRSVKNSIRRTYQSILNDMASTGFVPSPIRFTYFNTNKRDSCRADYKKLGATDDEVENDDDAVNDDEENDEDDDYEDAFNDDDEDDESFDSDAAIRDSTGGYAEDEDSGEDAVLVVLTLGKPGTEEFRRYEMWSDIGTTTASAKQALAKKALEDFSILEMVDNVEDIARTDYEWELDKPADSNIDRYLAGLLWTLQTYQDGVCPNYSYNYGKCMAPTGRAIAEYFEQAIADERKIWAKELVGSLGPGGAISAGLACLAALPASVEGLVPEPYSLIPGDKVEELYASCVDPSDNWFDMRNFEMLVKEEVMKITSKVEKEKRVDTGNRRGESNQLHNGRRTILGDHFWTVLSSTQNALEHPFRAPEPPSDKFAQLRPNSRIKVSRLISMDCSQARPSWNATSTAADSLPQNMLFQKAWLSPITLDVDHSDFGGNLLGFEAPALSDLEYKIAFAMPQEASITSDFVAKHPFALLKPKRTAPLSIELDHDSTISTQLIDTSLHNVEGMNAVVVLNRLRDVGVIGDYEFVDTPSNHPYSADRWELTVAKGFTGWVFPEERLKITQERCGTMSKKWVKHTLAARALDLLLKHATNGDGNSHLDRWCDFSFDSIKATLLSHKGHKSELPSAAVCNPEDQTALSVLNQLQHIGFVGGHEFIEFPSIENSAEGNLTLNIYKGNLEGIFPPSSFLSFTKNGFVPASKRVSRRTKQELASLALNTILRNVEGDNSESNRWCEMTFEALKTRLQKYSNCIVAPPASLSDG